jgi:hypothetical protein
MENKKADITSKQLITVIILVGSFLVILGFIFLSPFDEGNREVCHQSLVLRSGVNTGILPTADIVPLRCTTEKICIRTSSSEKCIDSFGNSTKENPVQFKKVIDRTDILDVLAEAHYDCHVLVGEGNLDFEPHGWTDNPYGLICSRISFSNGTRKILSEHGGDISFLELYKHMSKKQTKNNGNYLQFIYNVKNENEFMNVLLTNFNDMKKFKPENVSWFSSLFSNPIPTSVIGPDASIVPPILPLNNTNETQKVSENYNKFKDMNLTDWKINSSKEQAIIVQIIPKGKLESFAISGGILALSGVSAILLVAFPPAGVVTGSIAMSLAAITIKTGIAVSGISLYYTSPSGEFIYVAPTIYEYSAEVLRGINIYEFSFAPS